MPTPTLVQHVSCPNSQANTLSSYVIHLPNATLANNCLIVGLQYGVNAAITAHVADNKSNTWTARTKNSNGNQTLQIFTTAGATAGVTAVTLSFTGGSPNFISGVFSEYYNIATSTAVDVSTGNTGSGTALTAGSMTTTVDGDLIWNFAEEDGPTASEIWTAGSGFGLLSADTQTIPCAVQAGIQATHGAINPAMSMNTSDSWNSVAVALKSASAGTPPSAGIQIVRMLVEALAPGVGSPFTFQFPSQGNLLVAAYTGSPGFDITALTSTSNTWTQIGSAFNNGGSGDCQTWYAATASTSATLQIAATMTGTATGGSTLFLFDISGAATSPFDSTAGRQTASATQSVSGNITGVSINPSASNELVVTQIAISSNNITGENTGSFVCPIPSTFAVTNDPLAENNGWSIQYAASTGLRNYVWTTVGGAVGSWANTAVAFQAPASTPISEDDSFNPSTLAVLVAQPDPIISVW